MSFISYAQNFEDVLLWRALKQVPNGFYIDVGAEHPVSDSVSRAFYEHGWRGVHVEPNPSFAKLLSENRPDEQVIQKAVGVSNENLTYYEVPNTGLSTCDPAIAQRHHEAGFTVNEMVVASTTLADILNPFSDREIHWLKIDVEGWEKFVVQSWLPSQVRPWVVVIESTLPNSQIETHEEWEHLVLGLDYEFVLFDGLGRFYVSKQHPELKDAFRVGANITDDFLLAERHGKCAIAIQRLGEREQELGAEIAKEHLEAERLSETLESREQELAAEIAHSQAETERLGQLVVSLAKEIVARAAHGQTPVGDYVDARLKLADAQREHSQNIAELRESHAAEITKLTRDGEEQLLNLARQHENNINGFELRRDAEMQKVRNDNEQRLLALQAEHEARIAEMERSESFLTDELEKLNARLAKDREDSAEELHRHATETAALEQKHQREIQLLQNELKAERDHQLHLRNQFQEAKKQQEIKHKQQMRYRLGEVLVSAIDHPLQVFFLPWRMTKLLVNATAGRKWRLQHEKSLKPAGQEFHENGAASTNSRLNMESRTPVVANSNPMSESNAKKKLKV